MAHFSSVPETTKGSQMRLILASTSKYRRGLLERLGLDFDCVAPGVDETNPGLDPAALAVHLAVEKARAVPCPSGHLVIGSDQVVDLDGEILGKPGTREAAISQLERLQGRAHRLITGVAVVDATGQCISASDVHTLTMRPLSRVQLAGYVDHDEPLDCCGAYMVDRRGIALFEHIQADPEVADDTAIVGLPMMKLLRLLRQFGYDALTP